MKKIDVTENFIKYSKEMAEDLYGLADMNRNTELKKKLRYHIKLAEKYLNNMNKEEK